MEERRIRNVAHECTYQDFMKCQPLSFKGTEGVVGLIRWSEKMEIVFHISNRPERYQVKYATFGCEVDDEGVKPADNKIQKMETKFVGIVGVDNDMATIYSKLINQGNVNALSKPTRLQDIVQIDKTLYGSKGEGLIAIRNAEKQEETEHNYINKLYLGPGGPTSHPQNGQIPEGVRNVARAYMAQGNNEEEGVQGHYRKDCPKVKNQNRVNKVRVPDARGKAYVLGGGDVNSGSNTLTDLGSFDVIMDMDWLAKNHAVIVCDEKIVRILYGNEILIIQGDKNCTRRETQH
ncbi:hypothetical protein Tco_1135150 [Tanacetum coccineum]